MNNLIIQQKQQKNLRMKSTPRKTQLSTGVRVARPSGSYLHIRRTLVIIYHCLKMHIPFLYIIVEALTFNFVLIKESEEKKVVRGIYIFNDMSSRKRYCSICACYSSIYKPKHSSLEEMIRRYYVMTSWQCYDVVTYNFIAVNYHIHKGTFLIYNFTPELWKPKRIFFISMPIISI